MFIRLQPHQSFWGKLITKSNNADVKLFQSEINISILENTTVQYPGIYLGDTLVEFLAKYALDRS